MMDIIYPPHEVISHRLCSKIPLFRYTYTCFLNDLLKKVSEYVLIKIRLWLKTCTIKIILFTYKSSVHYFGIIAINKANPK
jgi:hypothetical protein